MHEIGHALGLKHPHDYYNGQPKLKYEEDFFQVAPVLLFAIARMNFENGKENRHAYYDTGQAMALLSVQATTLGLFVHQMAGIVHDQIQQTYSLPEGYEVVSAAAIGYYGETDSLAENLREMEVAPRARIALSKTVYAGTWEQPALL